MICSFVTVGVAILLARSSRITSRMCIVDMQARALYNVRLGKGVSSVTESMDARKDDALEVVKNGSGIMARWRY